MNPQDKEFQERLMNTFRGEANEHISIISGGLLELEKQAPSGSKAVLIENVYRELHSLKGAARSVGLDDIVALCQPMETAFSEMKQGKLECKPGMVDLLYQALNLVSDLISVDLKSAPKQERQRVREFVKLLQQMGSDYKESLQLPPSVSTVIPMEFPPQTEKTGISEAGFVRFPVNKIDPLFRQAEELMQTTAVSEQWLKELELIRDEINQELTVYKQVSLWRNKLDDLVLKLDQDCYVLRHKVRDHLESMKDLLLFPVSTLVEGFPMLVHDLSRDLGKEVDLFIEGSELEVDKRLLEDLKDPLIHLIRNCTDHGLEKPGERSLLEKAPRGSIRISFRIIEGRTLAVRVSDDGGGINLAHLTEAGIRAGLINRETAETFDKQELLKLVYQSGITTSAIISDISGRGLGLTIVLEKIEKLGGSVNIETETGRGTAFEIKIPLSRSTFPGILVKAGEFNFIFPSANVERTIRVKPEEIKRVENRETILVNGEIISVVTLSDILEFSGQTKGNRHPLNQVDGGIDFYFHYIILRVSDFCIAFRVDEVIGTMEVLVKNLGRQLRRVKNISGAAIQGSGKIVPVLNVADLMKSTVQSEKRIRSVGPPAAGDQKQIRILIAEDSITSRMLIKNILETAGYQVVTAVDGADGLSQVRTVKFDLIVSDVDMPRMNGFEFTAAVRKDHRLQDIPVVLVTALESRDDRERGIEAGANAYIVKSSFDQGNLLEVIRRLI